MKSERGFYYGFDVAFEPPIALEAGIQYSLDAFIRGPSPWRGEVGSSRVEHAGVQFFFAHTAGARSGCDTTVSQGQFPEFVFTVK